ncbi:hypothetical protein Vafri_3013 [Volvox africanus]|uniref:Uncharacterized protein n=1 Tax=Volvox africanus TaxID=51714 RepID=A0A8J4ETG6_9CHLO|nr:hypothetical protein Vafri_3013 [Volvox africanus]
MDVLQTSDVEIFAWDGEPEEILQGSQRCNRNGEARNNIVAFAYVPEATNASSPSAHYRRARYLVKPLGVFVKDHLRSKNDIFFSNDSLTKAEQPPSVVERGPVAVTLSDTRTPVSFSLSNYGTAAAELSGAWPATVAQAAPSPPQQPPQPQPLQPPQQGQQQQQQQQYQKNHHQNQQHHQRKQHQDQQWEQRQQWQQWQQWQPSHDAVTLFELSTHSCFSHRDGAPDGDPLLSKLHLSEPLLRPRSSPPFTPAATSTVFPTTASTATAAAAESFADQVEGPAALVSALAPAPASMALAEQLLATCHGTSISATPSLFRTGGQPRALTHIACSDSAALMAQNRLTSTGTSGVAESALPPSPSKGGHQVEQLRLHYHQEQQQQQEQQQEQQQQQQQQWQQQWQQQQWQLLHGQDQIVLAAQAHLGHLEAPALAAASKNGLLPGLSLLYGSSDLLLGGSSLQNQDINPVGSGDVSTAAASVPSDGGSSYIAIDGATIITNGRYNDSNRLAEEKPSLAHLLVVSTATATATAAAVTASAGGKNGVIATFSQHQGLLQRESLLRKERITKELLAGTQIKEEPQRATLGAAVCLLGAAATASIEGPSGLSTGPVAKSVGTGPTTFTTEERMRWSTGTSSGSGLDLDFFLDSSRELSPSAAAAAGGWTSTSIMSTHQGGDSVSGGDSLLTRELLQQQQQEQQQQVQQEQQHDLHLPPPPPPPPPQYQQVQQQPPRLHEFTAVQRRPPVVLDATHSGSCEGPAAGFPGPIRRLASAPAAAATKGAFTPQQSVVATARFQPYAAGRYFPTPARSPPPGGDLGSSRLVGGSQNQNQNQQAVPAGLHLIMPPGAVSQPPLPQP